MKILGIIEVTFTDDIKQMLAERRAYRRQQRFLSGYDYAAGKLLRGADPDEVGLEGSPHDNHEFDEGVQKAVVDFMNRAQPVALVERSS